MQLEGTVALITGGARRVGRAIALELASAGCDVALHYRKSQDEASVVAEQITRRGRRCETLAADLERAEAPERLIEAAVRSLGRLDILVNNASLFEPMPLQAFSAGEWERTMRVNLTAPAALCHHARAYLKAGAGGKIVNLCDASADRPWSSHVAYAASKSGLIALTRALAKGLAPEIQVNGVSPGIAIFPEDYDEPTRQALIDRVPLRRAGEPEDIARAVRFLVAEGDYITGQILAVDGGRNVA
jgi:pteridine reductase